MQIFGMISNKIITLDPERCFLAIGELAKCCETSLSLQWRHDEHDGVSYHQPHDCLLNRSYRHRSKKTWKLCVIGLCEENSPVTGEFPHKGPVTRKMFPTDDVIVVSNVICLSLVVILISPIMIKIKTTSWWRAVYQFETVFHGEW